MTTEGPGFIVAHGAADRHALRPGDPVKVYELAEEWPYQELGPHLEGPGTHDEIDSYVEAVLSAEYVADDWKVIDQVRCDCRSQRSIAQIQMHLPTAGRWLMFQPERPPEALRSPEESVGADAYPLHERPGEAPHVHGVTTCKGCRRSWLLVGEATSARAIRLRSAKRGLSVEP